VDKEKGHHKENRGQVRLRPAPMRFVSPRAAFDRGGVIELRAEPVRGLTPAQAYVARVFMRRLLGGNEYAFS
jgi:hypothetical protein